jgi:hypothetical protein
MKRDQNLLFDVASNLYYTVLNELMMIINELKKTRKETVMVSFKALSQHLIEGAEENPDESLRIIGVPAGTVSGHLSCTRMKRCCLRCV